MAPGNTFEKHFNTTNSGMDVNNNGRITDEISLLGSKVNHLTTGYSRGIVFAMHNVNPQDKNNVDIAILFLVLVKLVFTDTIQRFTITLHE